VLSDIPAQSDDRVLIDFRTSDDAGVYRWAGGPALVQTVDFFTPIVDDPYVYGQIAAANSISDIYAMGGRPLTALAIAAFPDEDFGAETIRQIFMGGFDKLREAGVALLGGHTVRDKEIKFGYAVTGAVDPDRILSNAGARAGDVLFLTKPLGTGIVGTAIKFDRATPVLVEQAVASMRTLNRAAADALQTLKAGAVHACTDVTGFGFAGHGTEMAKASGVTLEIAVGKLPFFDGVLAIAAQNRSGGLTSNQDHFAAGVRRQGVGPSDPTWELFFDPQTSGGLLVAVDPASADAASSAFDGAGVHAWRVGRAVPPVPNINIDMV
jgi:selenide,water dikinase